MLRRRRRCSGRSRTARSLPQGDIYERNEHLAGIEPAQSAIKIKALRFLASREALSSPRLRLLAQSKSQAGPRR